MRNGNHSTYTGTMTIRPLKLSKTNADIWEHFLIFGIFSLFFNGNLILCQNYKYSGTFIDLILICVTQTVYKKNFQPINKKIKLRNYRFEVGNFEHKSNWHYFKVN